MNTPLDELQWKSPEWIQAFGLGTENVLDYFSESPFFDKTSNNHVIKMQRQFSQLPPAPNGGETNGNTDPQRDANGNFIPIGASTNIDGSSSSNLTTFKYVDPIRRAILNRYPLHAMLETELMKLKGIEYVLADVSEPDFWLIRKQRRYSREQIEILQDYYIIGANVYQSPTVFNIVQSRLMSTSLHLSKTLEQIYKLTQFEPSQGVRFINPPIPASLSSNVSTGTNPLSGPPSTVNPMNNGHTISNNNPRSVGPQMTANTVTGGQTAVSMASTSQFDNSNNPKSINESMTKEVMNKLIVTSIRSSPEYI
ncbi:mediator complex subunit MED6 NDAI_0D01740 [Naumovozyma dairenensis CBS 421]|uniref:Mediator of RNA polymerase II transcription subunit 6 n=1 Tax=Naumovozyma dairenensis (strain ATCC 10597 / BCRC 20456 / CBS 421 / NBRC 0211 / NRRL Y-12639) TaxID=1071378 RepID=G0W9M7_NAUDC|nr:hypothetical protein NDAI_0D01740 [Naumovozyma dairenensis CBS 421]CCD24488.1 hypothetical protein NDAI_0D01740 [Naumovozyma dairenensis CBS 421]